MCTLYSTVHTHLKWYSEHVAPPSMYVELGVPSLFKSFFFKENLFYNVHMLTIPSKVFLFGKVVLTIIT
jgi:hypothetical protein